MWKFLENAFRDGEVKTSGTDIDKLMPPISRFGGGGRAKKKQKIIDKLKTFFEKYFGIGGSSKFIEPEHKTVTYDLSSQKTLSHWSSPLRLFSMGIGIQFLYGYIHMKIFRI